MLGGEVLERLGGLVVGVPPQKRPDPLLQGREVVGLGRRQKHKLRDRARPLDVAAIVDRARLVHALRRDANVRELGLVGRRLKDQVRLHGDRKSVV